MTPLSSSRAGIRAKKLEARRRELLRILRDPWPLILGTVYPARVRCGNVRCHCADGPGHPKTLLVYQEGGRRRCKVIRLADVGWVRQAAERYREFRRALRELRTLGAEEVRNFRGLARARAIRYR